MLLVKLVDHFENDLSHHRIGPNCIRVIKSTTIKKVWISPEVDARDRLPAATTIADGVIRTDADGRVLYCNQAAQHLSGYSAARVRGWHRRRRGAQRSRGAHAVPKLGTGPDQIVFGI